MPNFATFGKPNPQKIYKILSLISIIITVFLFSCSDNDITSAEHGQNKDKESEGMPLYMNIELSSVETASGSRANSYDQGTEDENKIVNGYVYVYEKQNDSDSEGDYVCVSSGNLLNGTKSSDSNNEISKKISFRNIEISNFNFDPESDNYYVLVILNADDDGKHEGRDKFSFPSEGQKFSEWAKKVQSFNMLYQYDNNVRNNYIVMTNATGHINKTASETFTPKTLVQINKKDISKIKFDNNNVTKTTIYVQRNVAKVRVSLRNSDNTVNNDLPVKNKLFSIGDFKLQINFSSWHLDRVNTKTFPVMNIDGLDWERSYSHSGNEFNRVHWAIDPNYDKDTYSNLYSSTTNIGIEFSRSITPYSAGKGESLYCLENTMDYDKMLQNQTTRVIMFWTLEWWGTDPSDNTRRNSELQLPPDYLYDANGVMAYTKDQVVGNNFDEYGMFVIGEDAKANIWDFKHIQEKLKEAAKIIFENQNITISLKQKPGNPTVAGKPNNLDGGYYKLSELIELSDNDKPFNPSDDEWKQFGFVLNLDDATSQKITYYPATFLVVNNETVSRIGVYYVIRIRHFSNSEGQEDGDYIYWDGSVKIKPADDNLIADYYPKHLGRYGVVRNNFYDIYITRINSLGSPQPIPEITDDDTDDMPEIPYIDVDIQVRPWTVRQNEFEF